jgi:hypothetical protein
MISTGVLEAVLRHADLPTLAAAEVTCSAVRRAVRSITIDCVIAAPPGSSMGPEALTKAYVGFIRWLRDHAAQFRSVVVGSDDPDMTQAIGTALAQATKLHTLAVDSSAISFTGSWNLAAAMTYAAPTPPPLRSLRLGRSIQSVDFLELFAGTLRALNITVTSHGQVRDVFALDLPHLEDLSVEMVYPQVVPLKSTTPLSSGLLRLRHLSLKNMSFMGSTATLAFPPGGLETLQLSRCYFLECAGFQGLRVLVSLHVNAMDYPECLDVSELSELTVSMGTTRHVPPHVKFPALTRFNAEQTDISMRPSQLPKIWAVALGGGCVGDTGWLLDVSRVFHLST